MSKFESYNIDLKQLAAGTHLFEYKLDDNYFKKIDSPEVQRGNLTAKVKITTVQDFFTVLFEVNGIIFVPCDRCLDDMELSITAKDTLQVKFGADYGEEGDVMLVPENDGTLNVSWFLYEMIVLAIPIKHVHAPGMCNKAMAAKLKKHMAPMTLDENDIDFDDNGNNEVERTIDPRWNGLLDVLNDEE